MSQIIFAVDVFYFLGFVGGGGVGNGHTGWGVMSAVFYINLFTLQRHKYLFSMYSKHTLYTK